MGIEAVCELYQLIFSGTENVLARRQSMQLRKRAITSCLSNGLVKVAFDTRRINQETDYIPRRGLQNYHRSEKFISDSLAKKIKAFSKLALILDELKLRYGKEAEWQDSYTRVLSSSVHKGLRTDQSDGDYSEMQPSMASLDYLEELMYVRYRLTPDDLLSMSEADLKKTLLGKDELLLHITGASPVIAPSDVNKYSYDQMMEKMFSVMAQAMSAQKISVDDNLTNKLFDVKATKDTPNVERTVTINIKDNILEKKLHKNSQQVTDNAKMADLKEDHDEIME